MPPAVVLDACSLSSSPLTLPRQRHLLWGWHHHSPPPHAAADASFRSSRWLRWSIQPDIANEMFTVPSFYNPLNVDVRIENVVYPRVEQVSPTTKKKKRSVHCCWVFYKEAGPSFDAPAPHVSSFTFLISHNCGPPTPSFPGPVWFSQFGRLYKVLNIPCYCFIVSYSFILSTVYYFSPLLSSLPILLCQVCSRVIPSFPHLHHPQYSVGVLVTVFLQKANTVVPLSTSSPLLQLWWLR